MKIVDHKNLNKPEELYTLKDILKHFELSVNKVLNDTPLNKNIPHESYLYLFEIYHIPSSIISTIALNYVYWFKNIKENEKNHKQNNPNNIPIIFFNSNDETLNKYKEEIFYAIAYIDIVVSEKCDMLHELSLKLSGFEFFKNSENYFLIIHYDDKKDQNYDNCLNNYLDNSKKYLKNDSNNLFLKQFAFRINTPKKTKDNFEEILNHYVKRYNVFKDAISVCNMFLTIQEFGKNISYSINLFDIFKKKFNKNDHNSEYFKSFYVNKILLQLTTYYTVAKETIKLEETIQIINKLGYKYKNIKSGEQIYLVKGVDKGLNAWYYVLVNPNLTDEFMKQLNDEIIHLEQLGIILDSAYGEEPPDNITEKIKLEYNIFSETNNQNDLTKLNFLSIKNDEI